MIYSPRLNVIRVEGKSKIILSIFPSYEKYIYSYNNIYITYDRVIDLDIKQLKCFKTIVDDSRNSSKK